MENLAQQFQIMKPQEWSKLTVKKVIEHGGCSLLKLYGLSLYRALHGIYPEVTWKREWFNIPKFPNAFWNSEVNQQEFLSEIARNYNLQSQPDWSRVSVEFIRKKGGQVCFVSIFLMNQGLLKKYNNSVALVLQKFYPEVCSNHVEYMNASAAHKHVLQFTKTTFI